MCIFQSKYLKNSFIFISNSFNRSFTLQILLSQREAGALNCHRTNVSATAGSVRFIPEQTSDKRKLYKHSENLRSSHVLANAVLCLRTVDANGSMWRQEIPRILEAVSLFHLFYTAKFNFFLLLPLECLCSATIRCLVLCLYCHAANGRDLTSCLRIWSHWFKMSLTLTRDWLS